MITIVDYCLNRAVEAKTTTEAAFWIVLGQEVEARPDLRAVQCPDVEQAHAKAMVLVNSLDPVPFANKAMAEVKTLFVCDRIVKRTCL